MPMEFVNRNKLRGLLAEKGLTQKDLAEELGMTLSVVNLKINGKRKFTEYEMAVLARLFGKDVFFLE